jgi:hypothetical protein
MLNGYVPGRTTKLTVADDVVFVDPLRVTDQGVVAGRPDSVNVTGYVRGSAWAPEMRTTDCAGTEYAPSGAQGPSVTFVGDAQVSTD